MSSVTFGIVAKVQRNKTPPKEIDNIIDYMCAYCEWKVHFIKTNVSNAVSRIVICISLVL